MGNRCFYWRCLPLGASPAVFIAQKVQRFAADYFQLKTEMWVFVFIDDFMSRPGLEEIDRFLEEYFGYEFSLEKRAVGSSLEFCGFLIDVLLKEIRVKDSLLVEICELAKEILAGASPFTFQRFCGKICFASQVAVEGRTNTFFIRSNVTYLILRFWQT